MIIRAVAETDIESIVEIGMRMHGESAYSYLPFQRRKVRDLIRTFIDDVETRCGLVALDDQTVVGMLGGYIESYYFCDERFVSDIVFFVDKPYRGSFIAGQLLRNLKQWAASRGAREVALFLTSEIDTQRAGGFCEALGFRQAGGVYKLRLETANATAE